MDKYVSGKQRELKVGISSYSEERTVIQTVGKVGIGTTNAEQYSLKVIGDTNIIGIASIAGDIYVNDIFVESGDFERIRVAGVSTFTNGPVLIGSATSTGTTDQKLQVTGSAYVSETVGINTENPDETLHVVGTIGVQNSQSGNHFYLQHNPVTNSLDFTYI